MNIDSCYQLGYVLRKHGLKGEVYIFLDVDDPGYYEELESVFIAVERNEVLVPFFVESISIAENKALVKFEGVDSAGEAERLTSCEIYLPLEFLPPLEADQFYFHEIIGFAVVDEQDGEIGKVDQVYPSGAQDLISLDHKGKQILFPVNDEIIKRVDKQNKKLFVSLPTGLLDVYLNP